MYVPEGAQAPEVIPALPQIPLLPPRPAFGGFWLRAFACVIDTIIIVAIFLSGSSFFPETFDKLIPPAPVSLMDMPQPAPIVIALLIALGCLYYTAFEASVWQATPGKRILRLYVTDLSGKRMGLGRALLRNLARQLSGFFFIGYILAGFTEKKTGLARHSGGMFGLAKAAVKWHGLQPAKASRGTAMPCPYKPPQAEACATQTRVKF